MTPQEEVRSWGFGKVIVWTDAPNSYYTPHSHDGKTTHLILDGSLSIAFPEETGTKRTTYGKGARVDVEAGQVHEVWVGSEGCRMVIGE